MTDTSNLFKPISSRRTFEMISAKIKDLVFDGVLQPGDKLPSESQLSQQFNVGRQTIREALRLLELSGFITIQKGSRGGPIIQDTVVVKIKDLFLDAFRLKKITLSDLTTARLEIERLILRFAFDNCNQTDIEKMKENVAQAREKIEAGQMATEENIVFHKLMGEASHNHVFVISIEVLMAVHGDFLSEIPTDIDISRRVVEYHEKILQAIIDDQRELADQLLEEHLIEVRERLSDIRENT